MHRRTYLFAMSCLTFVILGCGDTPRVILRDTVTSWNELTDTLYEIPDDPDTAEEVAGQLLKRRIKALKEKFDEIKKRTQKFQKADKDERPAVNEAMEDLHEEARFAGTRLAAQGRLRAIIAKVQAKTGQPTPNLEACASLFTQFTITLPSDVQKFPAMKKFGASWNIPGTGQGGGGMPGGMPGGGPGNMPGGGPGGMPPGMPPGRGMPRPPGP